MESKLPSYRPIVMAVMPARDRKHRPEWVERIKDIEKRLQRIYALEKD